LARAATGSANWYAASVNYNDSTAPGATCPIAIIKFVGGTFSQIATCTSGFLANDQIECDAQGSSPGTITALRNGTSIGSVSDNSLSSGGWGIYGSENNGDTTKIQMDNWAGGNFAAASTFVNWEEMTRPESIRNVILPMMASN
jgi:hypothetical protein